MPKTSRSIGLDPETDFAEIYLNVAAYEFPWDFMQALSFALFRTYAVPSIGGLLDRTGAFTGDTQKRYDDTVLLLDVPAQSGFDSIDGRGAIRRINQMHRMYDISNDDMRYTLSTFVVMPVRWVARYGWRQLTDVEVLAGVRYYQELGKHMGIKDVPATYAGFAELMDSYEAANFAPDAGAQRVAKATLDLMATFYPQPVRPAVLLFSRALLDESLIHAFGFKEPGRLIRRVVDVALRMRARFVAKLPPRRHPVEVKDLPRVKSYPNGFRIEDLGTFTPGCPVPHRPAEGSVEGQGVEVSS